VTLPSPSGAPTPAAAPPAAPPPPPEPVRFPLGWLLDHAAGPIKYRSLVDVVKQTTLDPRELSNLVLTHRPALTLASQQSVDGVWNESMLSTI
jgi:hypothetical protein